MKYEISLAPAQTIKVHQVKVNGSPTRRITVLHVDGDNQLWGLLVDNNNETALWGAYELIMNMLPLVVQSVLDFQSTEITVNRGGGAPQKSIEVMPAAPPQLKTKTDELLNNLFPLPIAKVFDDGAADS